ncbi:arginyltransferase [Geothermobacter hydrogeniphilus]|uniref:arginyltransferase n=1 Tax=Geothermobacter hydrogeniphilus TaxID=1969733 RepID=UPI00111C3E12|nr:arginyltransferase [Geothermobacter hydrogeniphilus]
MLLLNIMQILQNPSCEIPEDCPYLPGRPKSSLSFLARNLKAEELNRLLTRGWRKFGPYFFQPACPGCRQCIPVRVPVADFRPSRGQRRVERKGHCVDVRFGPLRITERAFEIYREHSLRRFGEEVDRDSFLMHFYFPSGPALQSEYRHNGRLIGIGYLDRSSEALSSIYFCYDPEFSHLRLGTLSVLHEISYTRQLGLRYYYLGYFVPGAERMAYKDSFRPREHYDWQGRCWQDPEQTEQCPAEQDQRIRSD